jgi:DNA-binding response OmpR family regulator
VAKNILVVDDDEAILQTLRYNLLKEGYEVVTATDGREAVRLARQEHPDLVVLDIMLPVLDGFEVCRLLRKEMSVPILMLSARESEIDKVVGLEIGADDYITKPFSLREFLARVKSALRRADIGVQPDSNGALPAPPPIVVGDLIVDLAARQVLMNGAEVALKPKEFDLLAFMARNRGVVLSRDVLLENVWGYDWIGETRTVDVHVRWLREKVEPDPSKPQYILTVRGGGYSLRK